MYNWSVNTKRLFQDKEQYAIWKLEQSINFGLGKDRLSSDQIKKNLDKLKIDPDKKTYLNLILYGKKPSFSQTKIVS